MKTELRDEIAIAMLPVLYEDDSGTVKSAAAYLGVTVEEYSEKKLFPTLIAKRAYEYADAMLKESVK
jgi:hypothetical protein